MVGSRFVAPLRRLALIVVTCAALFITPALTGTDPAAQAQNGRGSLEVICTALGRLGSPIGRGVTIFGVAATEACNGVAPINVGQCIPQVGMYASCEWARNDTNVQNWLRDPNARNGSKGDQFDAAALLACIHLAAVHSQYTPEMGASRLGCLAHDIPLGPPAPIRPKPRVVPNNPWVPVIPNWRQMDLLRYYEAGLRRAPDVSGWNYWSGIMNTNCTLTKARDTAWAILAVSNEMIAKLAVQSHELSSGAWEQRAIHRVYSALLNRQPDAAGLNYWRSVMHNNNPRDIRHVVHGLIFSAEYQNRMAALGCR